MQFDIKTVFVNGVLLSGVLTLYLFVLWWNHRKEFKGILLFVSGMICTTSGAALVGKGTNLSSFTSLVIGNTLFVSGSAFVYFALLRYFEQTVKRKGAIFLMVLVAVIAFVQFYTGIIHQNYHVRILAISLGVIIPSLMSLQLLYAKRRETSLPGILLAFGLLVQLVVFGGRLISGFIGPDPGGLLKSGNTHAFLLMIWNLGITSWPVGFSLLVAHRMKMESQKGYKEKTLLLQELFHRTKNNMQMFSSFLVLQRNRTDSEIAKRELKEAEDRIQAVALVHKKLYQAGDLSSLSLAMYVPDLVELIASGHHVDRSAIQFIVDVAPVAVSIDTITPLGLLLNELLTNSVEHAFPEGSGSVVVRIDRETEDSITCVVRDDGKGLSGEIDPVSPATLGLMTVKNLAEKQLHGSVRYDTRAGVECRVTFPLRDSHHETPAFC